MIEVESLSKSYGPIEAVKDVNFKVEKGDVMGFLGPNGAGKTTTMRILTGYMPASSGSARVAGFDVFDNPMEVKRRIGYLPERPPLYGYMVVRDYLRHVAELKGMPKQKRGDAVDKAIERTSLQDVEKRLAGHLSKGYQQRLGIAQAIIHDPDVLILDEPTIGLDPGQIVEIRHLIMELAGEHTIVLSTHILGEVSQVCNKVAIINRGRIVAADTLDGLRESANIFNHVRVRLAEHTHEAVAVFEALPGVKRVAETEDAFVVEAERGAKAAESIAKTILDKGWGLVEVSEAVNIEEIFLKLIDEHESQLSEPEPEKEPDGEPETSGDGNDDKKENGEKEE